MQRQSGPKSSMPLRDIDNSIQICKSANWNYLQIINRIKTQAIISNIVYVSWYHLGDIHHWLFGYRKDYVSLVTISNRRRLVDRNKLMNVWIVQLIMYIEYLADNSTKVISLAFFSPKMSSEYKDMKKVYLKVSLLLYILIISGLYLSLQAW